MTGNIKTNAFWDEMLDRMVPVFLRNLQLPSSGKKYTGQYTVTFHNIKILMVISDLLNNGIWGIIMTDMYEL